MMEKFHSVCGGVGLQFPVKLDSFLKLYRKFAEVSVLVDASGDGRIYFTTNTKGCN